MGSQRGEERGSARWSGPEGVNQDNEWHLVSWLTGGVSGPDSASPASFGGTRVPDGPRTPQERLLGWGMCSCGASTRSPSPCFSFPQQLLRTLILTRLTQAKSSPRAGCQGKREVAVLGSTKQDGWLPR